MKKKIGYQLKCATKKDIELLISYKLASILDYAHNLPKEELDKITYYVKTVVPTQLNDYRIIMINDQKIGCLFIEKYEDGILLDELYLEKNYRGKGIGTNILTDILTNNSIVYLWVYKENTSAFNLYKKLGFKIKETTETRYFMIYKGLKKLAIIEIGSNNTKTHIYENDKIIYENNTTIEFKKNYNSQHRIDKGDLNQLFSIVATALEYTEDVHVYGCSIFRKLNSKELHAINLKLKDKFKVEIEVVSQEEEANYTALGCYSNIKYNGTLCVFIGGGGSIELLFVNNGKVFAKKYYDFGVVDVTQTFSSLKDDIPTCTFDEVYQYVDDLIGSINIEADILILAGGDHLYWYNHAGYKLLKNKLYASKNQKYMITKEMSDTYDHDALITSLNQIRGRSDNPLWFDGSRAMKVITNLISNKIHAKYIIPTKINMEDGIKEKFVK